MSSNQSNLLQSAIEQQFIQIDELQLLTAYTKQIANGEIQPIIKENFTLLDVLLLMCTVTTPNTPTTIDQDHQLKAISEQASIPSNAVVHQVVRVERTESKKNKRIQWEFTTIDGTRIWGTWNKDNLAIDSMKHIESAGYQETFLQMGLQDVQRWQATPIKMHCVQNGSFWNIVHIEPRPTDVHPDTHTSFFPERKMDAVKEAGEIPANVISIDTETTGLTKNDQVVQIGILNNTTGETLDLLIKPTVPITPEARATHGWTDIELLDAKPIGEVIDQVLAMLKTAEHIIGYNIAFDMKLISQTLIAQGHDDKLTELADVLTGKHQHDLKPIVEKFIGDPYQGKKQFRYQSLAYACEYLSVTTERNHRALEDAQNTINLLKTIQQIPIPQVLDEDYIIPEIQDITDLPF